jgi:hypothetical protein
VVVKKIHFSPLAARMMEFYIIEIQVALIWHECTCQYRGACPSL